MSSRDPSDGATSPAPSGAEATQAQLWLAAIVENTDDAIIGKTLDGTIVSWNRGAERLYGYSADEAVGQSISILIPPDNPDELPSILARLARGQQIDHYETVRRRKDGTLLDVSVTISPVRDASGRIVGASAIARDVTERKRAEAERARLLEQIEIEQARREAVLQQMPAGVVIAEAPSGRLVFGNEQVQRIWRHPFVAAASVEEYTAYGLFHPDGRAYEPEEYPLARSLRTGEVVTAEEASFVRGDGSCGTLMINSAPIRDRRGRVVAGVATFHDVTEQKLTERRLRESEERFRAVFEDAAIGMALVSLDGRPFESNPALQAMLGYSADELSRMTFSQFTYPDDLASDQALYDEVISGARDDYQIEKRYVRKGGGVFWGRLTVSLVRGPDGQPQFAIGMVEDITARKQAEKMREEFLNLAAHELKTPLTAAKGCAQILMRRGAHDPDEVRLFRAINAQSDRMAHVVQTLINVTQIQAGDLALRTSRVDLCALAGDVLRAVEPIAPRHQLHLTCHHSPVVEADRERIREVLYNLLDNAVKYSPRGGPVEVAVDVRSDEAVVCVRDWGIGIPKEKQAQLFQVFYQVAPMVSPTTGMGLGLYISREIVHRHGGRIWLESEAGKGATVCFSLPLSRGAEDGR